MKKKNYYSFLLLAIALLSATSMNLNKLKQSLNPVSDLEGSADENGTVTLTWKAPSTGSKDETFTVR